MDLLIQIRTALGIMLEETILKKHDQMYRDHPHKDIEEKCDGYGV